jgi:AraC-binding-like domain
VVAQGEVVIEQAGRQAHLHAGDYALVDFSRPARWTNTWSTRVVSIAFVPKLLPLPADDVSKLTAIRFSADDGPDALFSSTARQLARHFDNLNPASGVRVGTATLDLLTVALAGRIDRAGALPSDISQRALILRMRAFIEDQLADPELTPAMVARAHHVSLRYVYKLFETERLIGEVSGIDHRLSRWIGGAERDPSSAAYVDGPHQGSHRPLSRRAESRKRRRPRDGAELQIGREAVPRAARKTSDLGSERSHWPRRSRCQSSRFSGVISSQRFRTAGVRQPVKHIG